MNIATSAGPESTSAKPASRLFLTTRQAAELLAVTPHRLAALRASGRGPVHYRTPTGAAMYFIDDLNDWNLARPTVIRRPAAQTRRMIHDAIR